MKELIEMSLEELWRLFPIVLKKHNPEYALWYKEESEKILRLLDRCRIYRINHIGSTAVKGLLAKPIVDILLELDHGYDSDEVIAPLACSGWILMKRDEGTTVLKFNKGYTLQGFANRVFHLHVRPAGDCSELYFRDYLKAHSAIAQEYASLKSELKTKFENNRDAYTEAKSDFIDKYTAIARKEFYGRYQPDINR